MRDVRRFINIVEGGSYRQHSHLHKKSDINQKDFLAAVDHLISDVELVTGLYDVPYTAGYNKNGTHVYMDKDLPQFMEAGHIKLDIWRVIALHEIVEASLLHSYRNNLLYLEAHQIATRIEREYVEMMGVTWEAYNDFVETLVGDILKRPVYKNVPADLDLQPYLNDRDEDLLKRMGISA